MVEAGRTRRSLSSLSPWVGRGTRNAVVALLALFAPAWCDLQPACAQDVVLFRPRERGQPVIRRNGEIVDYTGKSIRIRDDSGRARDYAADQVLSVQADWPSEHAAADQAMSRGDYHRAVRQYQSAVRRESRAWARRRILAQLVRCYRMLGQTQTAGETFLLIVSSDPTTPYFSSIPLAWSPAEDVPKQKAESWLGQDRQPAAVLLGASHLMSSDRRPAALAALRRLTVSKDPRIAALAEAQTWRPLVDRAGAEQLRVWTRRARAMPVPIASGPYVVLGRAHLRQRQWDDAALAFLRIPILDPHDRYLGAVALLSAAEAFEQMGEDADAVRLLDELLADNRTARWHAEAKARLKRLGGQDDK